MGLARVMRVLLLICIATCSFGEQVPEDTPADLHQIVPEREFAEYDALRVLAATKNVLVAEQGSLGFKGEIHDENAGSSLLYEVPSKAPIMAVQSGNGLTHVKFGNGKPIAFTNKDDDTEKFLDSVNEHSVAALEHGITAMKGHHSSIIALSMAVGKKGFQGNTHHQSLWLHTMASSLANKQAAASQQTQLVQTSATSEADGDAMFWRRRRRRRRRCSTPRFTKKVINFCGNKCFGRCGRGCGCWKFICGGCGSYQGCWEHDAYCSCCSSTNYRCASFMANSRTCNTPGCAKRYCKRYARRNFKCAYGGNTEACRRRRL